MTPQAPPLPGKATVHRTHVALQPNPDIPDRPWKATCHDCDWTWHSRWHVMALRMAHHHTQMIAAGRTR